MRDNKRFEGLTKEKVMTAQQPLDRKLLALRAFHGDLPQLWLEHPSEWVAYQGEQQIGFAKRKHLLYQQCFEKGMKQDEFVIFCVEPQETEITLGSVAWD